MIRGTRSARSASTGSRSPRGTPCSSTPWRPTGCRSCARRPLAVGVSMPSSGVMRVGISHSPQEHNPLPPEPPQQRPQPLQPPAHLHEYYQRPLTPFNPTNQALRLHNLILKLQHRCLHRPMLLRLAPHLDLYFRRSVDAKILAGNVHNTLEHINPTRLHASAARKLWVFFLTKSFRGSVRVDHIQHQCNSPAGECGQGKRAFPSVARDRCQACV